LIPKIIHQIWNDLNIPYDIYWPEWIESWPKHNPDWLCVLWTGERLHRFARMHFPEFAHLVTEEVPPIVRADIGRIMILSHFGGLYVDLDYICLKSFEPLIVGRTLFLPEVRPGMVTNALIAAEPGHRLLQVCLERAAERFGELDARPVQWISGPQLWQACVQSYHELDLWIAPSRLLCPADWENGYGIRRGVEKSTIQNAERLWPDAYAVTFWSHNW
jgi:mannosyltransferase OCH1-like enzyme